jgi:hypothetical protein
MDEESPLAAGDQTACKSSRKFKMVSTRAHAHTDIQRMCKSLEMYMVMHQVSVLIIVQVCLEYIYAYL